MFEGKIRTLRESRAIMKWGVGFKNKKLLVLTNLLNNFGFARKKLRNRIAAQLSKASINKEIILQIKVKDHDPFNIKYRLDDYSDYMGLGECLAEHVYKLPGKRITHFIDAGANIGFFSVLMFGKFPIEQAIAIEPNPANLDILKYNLSSFSNCSILPAAVSGEEGNVVFELLTTNTGHIKNAVGSIKSDSTVTVASKKLSKLIPGDWNMECTLVKLDIEGSEYEVIPDMFSNNLFPKIITGEIHDYLQHDGEGLVQLLQSKGYAVQVDGYGNTGNVCRQILAVKR